MEAPLWGAKNLRINAFPSWYFKISDTYTLHSAVRADCSCMKVRKVKYKGPSELREGFEPLEHL